MQKMQKTEEAQSMEEKPPNTSSEYEEIRLSIWRMWKDKYNFCCWLMVTRFKWQFTLQLSLWFKRRCLNHCQSDWNKNKKKSFCGSILFIGLFIISIWLCCNQCYVSLKKERVSPSHLYLQKCRPQGFNYHFCLGPCRWSSLFKEKSKDNWNFQND